MSMHTMSGRPLPAPRSSRHWPTKPGVCANSDCARPMGTGSWLDRTSNAVTAILANGKLFVGLGLALWMLIAVAQPVQFANGARITLPTGYGHELEEKGKTIAIRPAQRNLFTFRLTYHSLAQYAVYQPDVAEDFI